MKVTANEFRFSLVAIAIMILVVALGFAPTVETWIESCVNAARVMIF